MTLASHVIAHPRPSHETLSLVQLFERTHTRCARPQASAHARVYQSTMRVYVASLAPPHVNRLRPRQACPSPSVFINRRVPVSMPPKRKLKFIPNLPPPRARPPIEAPPAALSHATPSTLRQAASIGSASLRPHARSYPSQQAVRVCHLTCSFSCPLLLSLGCSQGRTKFCGSDSHHRLRSRTCDHVNATSARSRTHEAHYIHPRSGPPSSVRHGGTQPCFH